MRKILMKLDYKRKKLIFKLYKKKAKFKTSFKN